MFLVNSQWVDDKPLRADERALEQPLPWSFQPSEGRTAEGNLGQDPGSLCSRPGSGPDSLGHCLLVMSLFSASVPHLYNRKKRSYSCRPGCECIRGVCMPAGRTKGSLSDGLSFVLLPHTHTSYNNCYPCLLGYVPGMGQLDMCA